MTQLQAITAMKKQFPQVSVSADVTVWDYGTHVSKTFTVYAGTQKRAIARGEGRTLDEAIENCKEYN